MSILLPILIVGIAMAAERGLRFEHAFEMAGWPAAIVAAGSVVVPLLLLAAITRACERRLEQKRSWRYIDLADRALRVCQWSGVVVWAVAVLAFGWGATVQDLFGGDVIALDIIATILPPLTTIYLSWWVHFPIIRRIRHAAVLRAVDEGRHIPEIPSRLRFVNVQFRVQMLFLLVPLLLIASASEIIDRAIPIDRSSDDLTVLANEAASFASALTIFIFAPLFARFLLEVCSMPPGRVRDDLMAICREQKVRVRDVLLWRTDGTMVNAAVMGLFGFVRYVMITDALLETLRREQVLAVMAHEVGHVRRRHMPWLLVAIMAILLPPFLAATWAAERFGMAWLEHSISAGSFVLAYFAFGWVSRRFERQADTFAVQHLSGLRPGSPGHDEGATVKPEAVVAMQSALDRVAWLSGINPRRRSWRHGSIRWRQSHLGRIAGKPLRALSIDRQIALIKLASLGVFLASIAATFWLDAELRREHDRRIRRFEFERAALVDDMPLTSPPRGAIVERPRRTR